MRGGLYYELKENYGRALECYAESGNHSKVSELLEKNAQFHPGMVYYDEMEKYYRALPETEICASPALMHGHEHAVLAEYGLRRARNAGTVNSGISPPDTGRATP